MSKRYYTVIVQESNGSGVIVDRYLRQIAPEVIDHCGHDHTTWDGAERCLGKLLNWSEDGRTCLRTLVQCQNSRTC